MMRTEASPSLELFNLVVIAGRGRGMNLDNLEGSAESSRESNTPIHSERN